MGLFDSIIHVRALIERLKHQQQSPAEHPYPAWPVYIEQVIEYHQQRLTWLLNELNSTPPTQVFHRL